ncbi:MAG: hypothetical protein AABX73_00915 [Nanoarchaeota archaeon]
MVENKYAFLKALVFTITVFAIGLILGFFIEYSRVNEVQLALINSETNSLDEQTRTKEIKDLKIGCDLNKKSTFMFADKIYEEAKQLEKFDSANKFTNDLRLIHKKYDILRMNLWLESIELKEKCKSDLHTVVYIFEYASEDIETKSKQAALSKMLLDLKYNQKEKMLLIPIAGNLNLSSVDLVKEQYKIKKLPVIIIDEKEVISEIIPLEQLEKHIFKTNKE